MVRVVPKNLWSRGLLAATTVTTAVAGASGLAAAASISNTGPGSYNVIHTGHGYYGNHHQDKHKNYYPFYKFSDYKWGEWCWCNEHRQWDRCNDYNRYDYTHKQHDKYDKYDAKKAKYVNKDDSWKKDSWKYDGWRDDKKRGGHGEDHKYVGNQRGHDDKKDAYGGQVNDYAKRGDGYVGHGRGGGTDIRYASTERTTVNNDTDIDIDNNVDQTATSGDATSYRNTHGGNVSSGDATNQSNNDFHVTVDNTNATSAATENRGDWYDGMDYSKNIHQTGPGSHNEIRVNTVSTTTVNNDTDIDIDNNVDQTATSGDASSSRNTWGGHVSSGDARNVSNNSFYVSVKN